MHVSDHGAPHQTVDVGGYRLAYEEAGSGQPTIVLEAGMGQGRDTWEPIWAPLTQFARAVRYNRAGIGDSEPRPSPTCLSTDIITELQTLLTSAGIPGPYVLVGHSFGGIFVRHFAVRYSADVAGMVLLDATSEDEVRLEDIVPPEAPDEAAGITTLRQAIREAHENPTMNPQGLNALASLEFVRGQLLGDRPLAVLTAEHLFRPPDLPDDFARQAELWYFESQRALARLSSNSTYRLVRDSAHFIHADQPQVVVEAIRAVVEAVRSGTPLDSRADTATR